MGKTEIVVDSGQKIAVIGEVKEGAKVLIDDKPAPDGTYSFEDQFGKQINLIVKNGVISKVEVNYDVAALLREMKEIHAKVSDTLTEIWQDAAKADAPLEEKQKVFDKLKSIRTELQTSVSFMNEVMAKQKPKSKLQQINEKLDKMLVTAISKYSPNQWAAMRMRNNQIKNN